jgi:hypothetical protein
MIGFKSMRKPPFFIFFAGFKKGHLPIKGKCPSVNSRAFCPGAGPGERKVAGKPGETKPADRTDRTGDNKVARRVKKAGKNPVVWFQSDLLRYPSIPHCKDTYEISSLSGDEVNTGRTVQKGGRKEKIQNKKRDAGK